MRLRLGISLLIGLVGVLLVPAPGGAATQTIRFTDIDHPLVGGTADYLDLTDAEFVHASIEVHFSLLALSGNTAAGAGIISKRRYRVTVNSFLTDGGDNFSVLVDGTSRLGGDLDVDALTTYFGGNSPVPVGPQDRITSVT
jgi:hypothetical protein